MGTQRPSPPAGRELEAAAVATHSDLLGQLVDVDAVAAIASFVAVEARHGTVLTDIAGDGDDLDAMLIADAEPLPAPAPASGWRVP